MKTLIALLLLASPALAQTPLDISVAIAIAEAEAAQSAVRTSSPSPPLILPAVKAAGVKAKPVRSGYPVRGSWWSGCPNWTHLTRGEHAGQFDHAWLQSLSNAEIQSLHSDAHEGHVKSAYVVRPNASSAVTYQKSSSGCPGGVCPSSSRSRGFRLFRR